LKRRRATFQKGSLIRPKPHVRCGGKGVVALTGYSRRRRRGGRPKVIKESSFYYSSKKLQRGMPMESNRRVQSRNCTSAGGKGRVNGVVPWGGQPSGKEGKR